MLIKYNERFRAIFLKYIKDSEKNYSHSYSYNNYGYSGYSNSYYNSNNIYIYFYEWSDMTKGTKTFKSVNDFYEFLAESNIVCTEAQKHIIENNSWCYATCVPGKNILMVESQYYQLKEKLEKCSLSSCTSLSPIYY